jgi:actin-like ATPase involved in cell morphogenesis
MTTLPVPYSSGRSLSRVERRAAKEIALTRAASSVLAAREAAAIAAIASVGEDAMFAAADLSSVEELVSARTPLAAHRVAHIGDRVSMAMGDRVKQFARSL